jgi:membrane associated rhomboid family serine protease
MDLLDFLSNIHFYSENIFKIMGYVFILDCINWMFFGSLLNVLGIHPRKLIGIPGIILAPLLHGNLQHYLSNAFPFFFLSLIMIMTTGEGIYFDLCIMISLLSSFLIWMFARPGIHIGASALITGMYGWLVCLTLYEPTALHAAILGLLFIYFGFIAAGILPADGPLSWEGHLLGLVSGIVIYHYTTQALLLMNHFLILQYQIMLYFM